VGVIRLHHHDLDRAGRVGQRWRMIRRNRKTGELTYCRCWRSRHRWITPGDARPRLPGRGRDRAHPPPSGLIRLVCNELQHLLASLVVVPISNPNYRLRWSVWRRR
jgi:hypothetical protein